MDESYWKRNFSDFGKALERLQEALAMPLDERQLIREPRFG